MAYTVKSNLGPASVPAKKREGRHIGALNEIEGDRHCEQRKPLGQYGVGSTESTENRRNDIEADGKVRMKRVEEEMGN